MADNIKQFTSPVDKLQPSETGVDAIARMGRIDKENYDQAGREYGQIAKQAGEQIDNYEYMQEVSQGAAALAVMHNNMTTAWNKQAAATDPNDDTLQQRFMDSANDQLSKWQDGFSTERGQKWAMEHAQDLQSHLWQTTSADMGIRAGKAIVGNLKTTLENLSSVAGKDFSSIDPSLSQVDSLIANQKQSGYLDQKQFTLLSADMKNEIVKSGLKGLADKSPSDAIEAVANGKFNSYLSNEDRRELVSYSKGVQQVKLEDQQRAQENAERAQQQRNEEAADKISSLHNQDTGQLNIPNNIGQQIHSMDGVDPQTKHQLLGAVKHLSQGTAKDDPDVIKDFATRLKSDSNSPLTHDDLLSAFSVGKIKSSTFNFFNQQLKDTQDTKGSNDIMHRALAEGHNNIMGPSNGVAYDPATEQAYSRFQADFLAKFNAAMSNPKIMEGTSKTQKAAALTDPKSPVSIMPEGYINTFKPNGNDVVHGSIWDRLFGSSDKPARAPSKLPPTPPNVPPPNSPERKDWVKQQIFGNGTKQ